MKDEEIKQLLENVEVTPSARCWEAIESNLAAGAAATTAATATKAAAHALSTTAKVLIGIGSAAAIATTAVILALSGTFSPEESNVTDNPAAVTVQVPADNVPTAAEEPDAAVQTSPAETLPAPSESPATGLAAENPSIAQTDRTIATPAPVTETAAAKSASSATNPTPQVTTSATSAQTSSRPAAPTPSTSKPAEQPSAVTDMTDPVLEDAETLNSIDFSQPVALVIPNIITPNGDGANDFFIIKGIEQCDRNRLIIRNSSGAIVFQTINYQNNWDAPNLADGTYFYQFVYSIHGIEEKRAGTLTIMR